MLETSILRKTNRIPYFFFFIDYKNDMIIMKSEPGALSCLHFFFISFLLKNHTASWAHYHWFWHITSQFILVMYTKRGCFCFLFFISRNRLRKKVETLSSCAWFSNMLTPHYCVGIWKETLRDLRRTGRGKKRIFEFEYK
jgi:hypothetical protein